MPAYRVHLKTDTAGAVTTVIAENLGAAFDAAFALDAHALTFVSFHCARIINEITVEDPDDKAWVWRDDDLLLRLAAEDLLIAAKNLLTTLRGELLANGADRATLITLRHLKDVIDRAEGRNA